MGTVSGGDNLRPNSLWGVLCGAATVRSVTVARGRARAASRLSSYLSFCGCDGLFTIKH